MMVRRRFPSGARAARPAQIGLLAHHARGERSAVRFAAGTTANGTPARRRDALQCCREAALFSQWNLREGLAS